MGRQRPRVCRIPGCPTISLATLCPTHAREADRARGSAHTRGYDHPHRVERARWQARIDRGELVVCATCPTILTGRQWDLGHDHTNGGHLGPQCWPCNRGDGGRRGAQATNHQ